MKQELKDYEVLQIVEATIYSKINYITNAIPFTIEQIKQLTNAWAQAI